MRVLSQASILLLLTHESVVRSFTLPQPPFCTRSNHIAVRRPTPFTTTTHPSIILRMSSSKMSSDEFDSILREDTETPVVDPNSGGSSRNVVGLPETSQAATLDEEDIDESEESSSSTTNDETFTTSGRVSESGQSRQSQFEDMVRRKNARNAPKATVSAPDPSSRPSPAQMAKNYLKGKDFGELFFFAFVPVVAVYYFGKKAIDMGSDRMGANKEELLDSYANEMIYHDGDFVEMKLCNEDYGKKLLWMGPTKNDAMIKRYLEFYAKKKTVSPQAISSLSYVFSMYNLSEDRTAKMLTELVQSMPEKVASAGKLLFFGEHIFKTPEAKAKLEPIKQYLAAQYNDMGTVSGIEIVEKSQRAMGEAAYKSAVANDGKNQKEGEEKLTVGWEVLGLEKDVAMKIWEESMEEGFKSEREKKYDSGEQGTFDSKGRKLNDDGMLENPEEATEEDGKGDDDMDFGGENMKECSQCGYTLFIAEGRESVFFGPGFKCPECGASKDQFVSG